MTDQELELLRDEIGDEPADNILYTWFDDLGHWIPVALRILRRRRANSTAGGEASSFTLTGVLSVGLSKPSTASLDAQIARLQAEWDRINGKQVGHVGRVIRTDR